VRFLISVLLVGALAGAAVGEPGTGRESNLLVALPGLGSVTWRCGATDDLHALGYREFWSSATTTVTLRAGRRTIVETVQPHQLISFPYLRTRIQSLTFIQFTEPGTLRAVVRIDFGARPRADPYCQPYLPPRFVVNVYPRPNGR
jgi:hypothetical protein